MSKDLTLVENPFANSRVSVAEAESTNAVQKQEQERAIAETKAAIMLAKQFPRDEAQATNRIIMACCRPTLAERAVYSYPKGGQEVTGASIRLAEAIAQAWGNIQFGIRELDQRDGISTVEAFAWDVENNTRQTKVFQVSHKRHTKKGAYMITDPREIYEMVANQGARRMRNCILGLIPGDVVEAAVNQADRTLTTKVEITQERIAKMIETFESMGVSKEAIKLKIGRNVDATMPPAVFANLGKICNSIREGYATAAEHFDLASAEEAQTLKADNVDNEKAARLFDELEIGLSSCSDKESISDYITENKSVIDGLALHGAAWAKKWASAVASHSAKVGE